MERIPHNERKPINGRNMPKYTVLRCRAGGRHQVGWCFRMCQPVQGIGLCGRSAPHAIKGQHLLAMEKYYEKLHEQEEGCVCRE
jgi:hypothetical protein